MNLPPASHLWLIVAALGLGTYLVRLSFLGLVGRRPLPPLVLRLLRFTPVAVLPALVAPLVAWPEATGGAMDLPRLAAALVTAMVAGLSRNAIAGAIAGGVTLTIALQLAG